MGDLIPLFECKLRPKDEKLLIEWVIIRLHCKDQDECFGVLERLFPQFEVEHIIEGYRRGF